MCLLRTTTFIRDVDALKEACGLAVSSSPFAVQDSFFCFFVEQKSPRLLLSNSLFFSPTEREGYLTQLAEARSMLRTTHTNQWWSTPSSCGAGRSQEKKSEIYTISSILTIPPR